MGALAKNQKAKDKEVPVSSFIPYSSLVTKEIVKLDSGDYMFTLKLQGVAHESADTASINIWHEQLNNFLRMIASPQVAIWTHTVRREHNEFPGGTFAPGFARRYNEKYKQHIQDMTLLVNDLYVSVVYRPGNPAVGVLNKVFSGLIKLDPKEQMQRELDALEAVHELISQSLSALERYDPQLLTCYYYNDVHTEQVAEEYNFMYSETLEFLAYLCNGVHQRVAVTRGEIKHNLMNVRPFFGKNVMGLSQTQGNELASMLVIQEYPTPTFPGCLNQLLQADFKLIVSQSFTFIDKTAALGRMKRQQGRFDNAGEVALSQTDELTDAMDDLASNRFVLGTHHMTVMVKSNDLRKLKEYSSDAGTMLADIGIKYFKEDLGLAGCFWSQLPGNFSYRVRKADITSRNFASFASFHNYPTGHIRGNQWGDAVTALATASNSIYYANYHKREDSVQAREDAKIDPNHKDLANMLIVGVPGTGKTVTISHLLTQSMKFNQPEKGNEYKQTIVLFDKDYGCSGTVRALGGRYLPLKMGKPTGFNPFALPNTKANQLFVVQLLERIITQDGYVIQPLDKRKLNESVQFVFEDANLEVKTIESLGDYYTRQDDDEIWQRLAPWVDGQYRWVFNNEVDTLDMQNAPILGFDVTDFLESPEVRTPVIMYLFQRIDELLDGRRVPIVMEEFAKLIDDPYFRAFTKNKQATIRKQNGFLVLVTQATGQFLDSEISYALIELCATYILMPNEKADPEDYIDGLKLTSKEFELVKNLGRKSRKFLIKQGDSSVVAELNLKGFDDELAIFSTNTHTSTLIEDIIKEVGDDPEIWIPIFHERRKGITA